MALSVMASKVKLRRYRTVFHKAHATVPDRAIRPSEYSIIKDEIFNRLERRKIIVNIGNDKFYFDDQREKYLERQASIQVISVLAIVIILVFLYFLWKTP